MIQRKRNTQTDHHTTTTIGNKEIYQQTNNRTSTSSSTTKSKTRRRQQQQQKIRMKKKRRRRRRGEKWKFGGDFILFLVGILVISFFLLFYQKRNHQKNKKIYQIIVAVDDKDEEKEDPIVMTTEYYDAISQSTATTAEEKQKQEKLLEKLLDPRLILPKQKQPNQKQKKQNSNHQYHYSSSWENFTIYSDSIMKKGCSVSIVFMDPRLPILIQSNTNTTTAKAPAWFALESIGAFLPNACVILQTSYCNILQQDYDNNNEDNNIWKAKQKVSKRIYEQSMPLFRRMIHRGLVRISFPSHKKYKLRSCDDFYNPSSAFMNIHYWTDEFLFQIDSDTVLILQSDSILCRPINISLWSDIAYVGAVWPSKSTSLNPIPLEGMCMGMPSRWLSWLRPQRLLLQKKKNDKDVMNNNNNNNNTNRTTDSLLLDFEFPSICSKLNTKKRTTANKYNNNNNNEEEVIKNTKQQQQQQQQKQISGLGPIGNGGFSLRKRSWLIHAIRTCPHIKYSGLTNISSTSNLRCKVLDEINEDFYFSTILFGLKAPMPSAYEASLFSVEMLWPEEVQALYGLPPSLSSSLKQTGNNDDETTTETSIIEEIISRRWGKKNGLHLYHEMHAKQKQQSSFFLRKKPKQQQKQSFDDNTYSSSSSYTYPLGMHKPWWYQSNDLLLSDQTKESCPFLSYIFHPLESKWKEIKEEIPWRGIGT